MIDPNPFPSPLLKLSAFIAKWALALAALVWVVFVLVWGGLHFVIVPRINESRPWLEQLASKNLGLPVQIGSIHAQSNGLIPSISLQNVVVSDLQGQVALRVPSLVAAISPQSLLVGGTEALSVEGAELHIRRTSDGSIFVAGVLIPTTTSNTNDPVTDWVFSQPELLLQKGTVHWSDELRNTPVATISDIDLVMRNGLVTHTLKLEASPPTGWGERISASAEFKEPFIGLRSGHWSKWKGEVYAQLPHFDITPMAPYVELSNIQVRQGSGSARAWLEVQSGSLRSLTADVALQDVNAQTQANLPPLALRTVTGRLGIQFNGPDVEYFTQSLQFETADGLLWPGGNVRLQTTAAGSQQPEGGAIVADKLDIAAVMNLAERLPLSDSFHGTLRQWTAKGLVDQLQATWKGSYDNIQSYTLKGQVKDLALSASKQAHGIKGLNVDFDLNNQSGKATFAMRKGVLDTFGLLDENTIPVDQLNANLQWLFNDQGVEINVSQLQFSNNDAQGTAKLSWKSGAHKPKQNASLGQLDLQGTLSRLDLMALNRYLPKVLDNEVRNYLREAIVAGRASDIKYRIKGELDNFPFTRPEQGELNVSANLQNVGFAYAPAAFMPKNSLQWPALQQVSAQLEINQDVLQVKNASGKIAGTTSVQFSKAESTLKQLFGNGFLTVTSDARANLPEALKLINNSPLSEMTGHVLAHTTVSGSADVKIKMALPILEPERATLQGQIDLNGNDFQLMPEIPRLSQVRGQLAFTENGFNTKNLQARALGGDMRIQGGLHFADNPLVNNPKKQDVLRIQGTITSAGLRQARELDELSRLGQYFNGTTTYAAVVGLEAGHPEIIVTSNLAGMALNFPAPFNKPAETVLPIRFENSIIANQSRSSGSAAQLDKLQLNIGKLAAVSYVRDISSTEPNVLRGSIAIGLADDESAPLPDEGVVANINIPQLNLDAWSQVANTLHPITTKPSLAKTTPAEDPQMGYVPSVVAIRSKQINFGGRLINQVVVGGGRNGLLWRANLDAAELSGYVEYLQPSNNNAGRLYSRLARLTVKKSQVESVEALLDEQPISIPALDIVIQNFELHGKNLGKVEIEAVNRGTSGNREQPREWRLNRFNITMPEATLTALGNWSSINPSAGVKRSNKGVDRRRTVLNFKLDIHDTGALLSRFGTEGVLRKGSGKVEGQVAWLGSPLTLDYGTLGGNFVVNIENGQFLKADPGIAKLIGVLSLQALPRRLTLDFKDVFSEGFSFDFIRGDVSIENGIARTNNLQMKGINAAVLMEGQADIAKETQNIKVVVIPELNAGSASLIATAINPVIGISTFLAQLILRRPLVESTTMQFLVDGSWLDPKVTRIDRKTGMPETKP